jgi:Uma2 family endonuclease
VVNPSIAGIPASNQPYPTPLPPLENGDRLSRQEFERRYHAMPHLKKAELIEGVVYVPSPLRFSSHAQPHASAITWLGVYQAYTPSVKLGDNPTIRLDLDNEPQPDAVLLIDPSAGGRSRLSQDDYIEGAPELIVEIAASSAAYDLYDKKRVYRRNGVREYLVWQIFEQKLDWFELREDEYVPLVADANGTIKSCVFPGLWLAVPEILEGNMPRVLAVLQEGLNSAQHAEFVNCLARAANEG